MASIEALIGKLRSREPAERVKARIELLRNFNPKLGGDIKENLIYGLIEDIKANRQAIVDYVLGITELNDKAYTMVSVNIGLKVDNCNRPPNVGTQKDLRKRFVNGVEDLADALDKVEDSKLRLSITEIIAREGHQEPALNALDKIWSMGWDTKIKYLAFGMNESYDPGTVADVLETIIEHTKLRTVKEKALHYLSEIPNSIKRKQYLLDAITSEDGKTAIKALEIYREKAQDLEEDRLNTAVEIMTWCKKNGNGEISGITNCEVVRRVFDEYIKGTEPDERLSKIYYFLTDEFIESLKIKMRCYPEELDVSILKYLENHIEDVITWKNKEEKGRLLLEAAFNGNNNTSLKAIECIAKTENPMYGVENIANLYTTKRHNRALPERSKRKVRDLAIKYTRQFADLEDKKLARTALYMLTKEPALKNGKYIEKGTGKGYGEVAKEELVKVLRGFVQEKGLIILRNN